MAEALLSCDHRRRQRLHPEDRLDPGDHRRRARHRRRSGGPLPPRIAGKLLRRIRDVEHNIVGPRPTAASAIHASLTDRELEIFKHVASGDSNQQIASDLSLSTNTIANHITSILAKLHLQNRIQAAVHSVRAGIS
jgi:DNA-binding NarL/FixJ family response regulator